MLLIQDQGTFRNLTTRLGSPIPAEEALEEGHLLFHLEGEKTCGDFVLQRHAAQQDEEQWTLMRARPEETPLTPEAGTVPGLP